MKTNIHVLTALLVMNFTLLYAGDPKLNIMKARSKTDNISLNTLELAPVTPKEVIFKDIEPRPVIEISRLAPITPKEATFEESKEEISIPFISPLILQKIAPETPKEAGFEEIADEPVSGIESLAPDSPVTALFED